MAAHGSKSRGHFHLSGGSRGQGVSQAEFIAGTLIAEKAERDRVEEEAKAELLKPRRLPKDWSNTKS